MQVGDGLTVSNSDRRAPRNTEIAVDEDNAAGRCREPLVNKAARVRQPDEQVRGRVVCNGDPHRLVPRLRVMRGDRVGAHREDVRDVPRAQEATGPRGGQASK